MLELIQKLEIYKEAIREKKSPVIIVITGLFGGEGGIRTGIYWILPSARVSLQMPLSTENPSFLEKYILFDVSACRLVLPW